jgi:RND superfamily putative drug exporter
MAQNHRPGLLARAVQKTAGASARRPRLVIALWLALVAGCLTAGAITGVNTFGDSGVGESARADARLAAARLEDPAVESILVRSADPATTAKAADALVRAAGGLRETASVTGPRDTPDLSTAGGRQVLVQVALRGDPDDAPDRVEPLARAVEQVGRAHPGAELLQSGPASVGDAIFEIVEEDLRKAELISLPITLVLLVLVFGALVAASVPLLLGVTSVAAALGAMGPVSQLVPMGEAVTSMIVLIGLAVGVDYSLFYIRREREERRAGRDPDAALRATSATVGRAIVVSGATVLLALAGLLVPGLDDFTALGIATMLVVLIAVAGSLTVLPAVLALLGDRIDKGRIPVLARIHARRARRARTAGRPGLWGRVAAAATRRPVAALVTAACLLGALAVPALDMHASDAGANSLPRDTPVMQAKAAIERAFPGSPAPATLAVTGDRLDRAELTALGERARAITGGRGAIDVAIAEDGRTAAVDVPMPAASADDERRTVAALRDELGGPHVEVTGQAAAAADFTARLDDTRPLVIAFVLALAFVLVLAAFRSVPLAAAVMGLNLLSVGATYGVLTAVFQHTWAEDLLGFTSNGTITNWVPLNAFVILFGLSMDYTILVLERIREARRAGRPPREAAAEGVAATAGTVTGAAAVMVAIFAIFPMLSLLELKELGVCLAVGVLLDATIVRGVALPATVALLGRFGPREKVRAYDERATAPTPATSHAGS